MDCTTSITDLKLPKIRGLTSAYFDRAPEVFTKMFNEINLEISTFANQKINGEEIKKMKEDIRALTVKLAEDGTFTAFNSYMNNNDVIININRDKDAKERLNGFIGNAFMTICNSPIYSSVLLQQKKAIIDGINKCYQNFFESYKCFLTEYKNSVKRIVDEINNYFEKTHQVKMACDCTSSDINSLVMYCKAGGEYNEVKEGLQINYSCPICKTLKTRLLTKFPKIAEVEGEGASASLANVKNLLTIYTNPCKQCKKYENNWNKYDLTCGCMYCPPCLKAQSRVCANMKILGEIIDDDYSKCGCGKPFNDEYMPIALGEDLENIHGAVRRNLVLKLPKTSVHLLCTKCGKIKEVPIANAKHDFQCC